MFKKYLLIIASVLCLGICADSALADSSENDISGRDAQGNLIELKQFRGKVVLINFWASYLTCSISSLRRAQKMYNKYKSRGAFVVLAVGIGNKHGTGDEGRIRDINTYKSKNIKLGTAIFLNCLYHRPFGMQFIPYAVLISKTGKIIFKGHSVKMIKYKEHLIEKALSEEVPLTNPNTTSQGTSNSRGEDGWR